nr:transposase [Shewanella khirikhana]
MVLELVVFWRNQLEQSTPYVSTKLNKKGNIWGFPSWERLSVFFDYPPQTRKVIYLTNAIKSLNATLRKVTKTRRSFPNDRSVMKVLYLALHQIAKKWMMPIRDWKQAISQFTVLFCDRVSPGN